MKRVVLLLAGLLLVGFSATPASADVPPLPHAFYGEVEINDGPAPVGIQVEARGDGVLEGTEWNPIEVTEAGYYGGPGGLDPKLVVQGNIEDGTTLTFYVNGESTGETAEWHSGEITEVPLSLTTAAPPDGVGVGAAPRYYLRTDLFDVRERYRISEEGEIRQTIGGTSEDGILTMSIAKGTIALDKDGDRLEILEVGIDESRAPAPDDAHIIGLAYYFDPAGASFDPPITLTWSYDPEALPEGVAEDEETLFIAYYDEAAGQWVQLDGGIDIFKNTVTGFLEHLATVTIIAAVTPLPPPPAAAAFLVSNLSVKPAEVQLNEAVTITVSVANTGGTEGSYRVVLKMDGVKEAEKRLTIAAGSSEMVTFSVTREGAGSYSVAVDGLSGSFTVLAPAPPPPPPPPTPTPTPTPEPVINWLLIGGIIAAAVIVGLGIFVWLRRRAD